MKPYKKYFQKITLEFYPVNAVYLIEETNAAFNLLKKDICFATNSADLLDKRLEIAQEYVRPKNKFQSGIKRLPARLFNTKFVSILVNQLRKKTRTKGLPGGFIAEIVTDTNETSGLGYGFDIIECGIYKLFAKHDCKKHPSILCEVDYITSNLADLTLIKKDTIANGAKKM